MDNGSVEYSCQKGGIYSARDVQILGWSHIDV